MKSRRTIADGTSSDYCFVMHGSDMAREEAKHCEEAARSNPLDVTNRLMLIGYYGRSGSSPSDRKRLYSHYLWFVKNHPSHFVHRWLHPDRLTKAHYLLIKEVWIKTVRNQQSCREILFNAANFFMLTEPKRTEKYLMRGQKLEPGSVDWPLALSHLYRLLCNRGTLAQKRDQARKSFKVAFRAIYLHRRFRRESYLTSYEGMVLSDLARLALTPGIVGRSEMHCIEVDGT